LRRLWSLALAAGLCLAAATPAHAIVFNFSWSSNAAQDPTIVSSTANGATVTGTMTINAPRGSSFGLADIAAVNLTASGGGLASFGISFWQDAAGSIAADGLSAAFVGAGSNEPFVNTAGNFFGCRTGGCDVFGGVRNITVRSGTTSVDVLYTSGDAALASMRLTSVATVPLPAALPLAFAGVAVFGFAARARRRTTAAA